MDCYNYIDRETNYKFPPSRMMIHLKSEPPHTVMKKVRTVYFNRLAVEIYESLLTNNYSLVFPEEIETYIIVGLEDCPLCKHFAEYFPMMDKITLRDTPSPMTRELKKRLFDRPDEGWTFPLAASPDFERILSDMEYWYGSIT